MKNQDIAKNLEKLLDRHGYSFQYRVVKEAETLRKKDLSAWRLEGTEIPVGTGTDITHVDMVFSTNLSSYHEKRRLYLIGECKRADPSRSHWCFLKSPYTWRNPHRTNSSIQFDKVVRGSGKTYVAYTQIAYEPRGVFELGFETRTHQQTEGIADPRGKSIDTAVTQVLRGVRGYINYMCRPNIDEYLGIPEEAEGTFIPVVFTTAKLFTTTSDIADCELEDGRMRPDSIELQPVDWLWFNHNRSVSLTHDLSFNHGANKDVDIYYRDFTRSIAIVNYAGIGNFLGKSLYGNFV